MSFSLGMSIIGYEVGYTRGGSSPTSPATSLTLRMFVNGASAPGHLDKPLRRATVHFSEGPFGPGRWGEMKFDDDDHAYVISATLPWADFAAIWAALTLNRSARLECLIEDGTNNLLIFKVESEGRPHLFG